MKKTLPPLDLASLERALRGRRNLVAQGSVPVAKTAAVYVLFSRHEGAAAVTLIRRSDTVSQHRGEYAFPGGGVEPHDRNFHDTALREVHEELGVPADAIEPWGELSPEMTVTSGFLVVPFTGRLDESAPLSPAPDEVSEVVRVPVASLIDPLSERTISRLAAQPYTGDGLAANGGLMIKTHRAYAYDGRVIWGATARILAQVISAVQPA